MSALKASLAAFAMVGLAVILPMISAAAIEPLATGPVAIEPLATEPVATEAAAIDPVSNEAEPEVTTLVPPSFAFKEESTQPPTKVDTEFEPFRCFCNLPECADTSSVCYTKLGCFTELRTNLPFAGDAAEQQQRSDEDGASGCLEMTPIKKSCGNILESMESLNSEFPHMRMQNKNEDAAIRAYHCCQTDMCNDKVQVAYDAPAVHEKLVAAYKSSMAVRPEESDATTMNATVVEPTAVAAVNGTESTTDNSTAEAVESTTIYPDVTTVVVADSTTTIPEELTTKKAAEYLFASKPQLPTMPTGKNSTDEIPTKQPEVLIKEAEKEEIVATTTTAAVPELPLAPSAQGEKEVM